MYIIAKTKIGSEFMYNNDTSILVPSEKKAHILSNHLNTHNDTSEGLFKCKDGEHWYVYEIDKYHNEPRYKLVSVKPTIQVREI